MFAPRRLLDTSDTAVTDSEQIPISLLYAALLRTIAEQANRSAEAIAPDRLILTHPARWGIREFAVLRAAAEAVGLPAPGFVSEPVAAACDVARKTKRGRYLAVLDVGGSTIDGAVLRRTRRGFVLARVPSGVVRYTGAARDAAVRRAAYELLAAIQLAGLTSRQLAAVYLVGGGSGVPGLAEIITEILGVRPQPTAGRAIAVVLGALEGPVSTPRPAWRGSTGSLGAGSAGLRFPVGRAWRWALAGAVTVIAAGVILGIRAEVGPSARQAGTAAAPVTVPRYPLVSLAPDAQLVYVATAQGTVIPVDTTTRSARPAINVGGNPSAGAFTLDGRTLYVGKKGTLLPVNTATGLADPPIAIGSGNLPVEIVMAPGGRIAYVLTIPLTVGGTAAVTPVNLITRTAGVPIPVEPDALAFALTPSGQTIYYVGGDGSLATLVPISVSTRHMGPPIELHRGPSEGEDGIVITPDGKKAIVVSSYQVTEVNLPTRTAGPLIPVGNYASGGIAITPDGQTAYVTGAASGTVTPIDTATGQADPQIAVPNTGSIAITPDGQTAYVYGNDSLTSPDGTITPIDLKTGKPGTPIPVDGDPTAVYIP